MIAACPKCKTKFRIAKERLRADGVRLRCTQCSAVFRVKAPEAAGPHAEPAVEATPTPVPRQLERERLVLVAHSDPDLCKRVAEAVERWGLCAVEAHDGVEAILATQRLLPRAVVLDAALPKMYGFQVCELVKRNESLRSIGVVLVGAIHDQNRYRRPAADHYGADHYCEAQDLPDALQGVLSQLDLPVAGAPTPTPAAPPVPAPPVEAGPASVAGVLDEAPAPAEDGLGEERAKAERLARIIVSDVILYNEEKFAAAAAAGNVIEAMDADLDEGRGLFQSRIDPRVAAERDYLQEELLRVAGQRGAA